MNNEENRLNTFTNWPSTAEVEPIRIAKAGFYFTGQGVEVQCFSCGGKISEWNYGDQVMARHRRLDPNCPFVVNPQTAGNVPLVLNQRISSLSEQWPTLRGFINNVSNSNQEDHYGLTEDDEMYKNDALRLLSFVNWPESNVSREQLVNAGLYHIGDGRVRCAWCGGELAGVLGPDPVVVHHRNHPLCRHAAEVIATRNAPLVQTVPPATPPLPMTPPSRDNDTSHLTDGALLNAQIVSGSAAWQSLGVIGGLSASGGARHPANATFTARLASYNSWPSDRPQTPAALAEAGFYYTGKDDRVRCFYCDGGLGCWEAGDAPWSEHARWFPECGYVLLLKGREFVDECQNTADGPRAYMGGPGVPRRASQRAGYPVDEALITEHMENAVALSALSAGLDAARVRRAVVRRLRQTGIGFRNAEQLIDAALDGQLNEEAWTQEEQPLTQSLARDIVFNTFGDMAPSILVSVQNRLEQTDGNLTPVPLSPVPEVSPTPTSDVEPTSSKVVTPQEKSPDKDKISLAEENRQLKEARLCKVCMDREVSVVFLPCGHLVSCAECGASLGACPLCRATVRALVRAYLA